MHRPRPPIREIVIVDQHPDDYAALLASAAAPRAIFHFATTADDAIRMPVGRSKAVWLINLHLPDLPGLDLAHAVCKRSSVSSVLLVSDRLTMDEELHTRELSSLPIVCKPPLVDWLTADEAFQPDRLEPEQLVDSPDTSGWRWTADDSGSTA